MYMYIICPLNQELIKLRKSQDQTQNIENKIKKSLGVVQPQTDVPKIKFFCYF